MNGNGTLHPGAALFIGILSNMDSVMTTTERHTLSPTSDPYSSASGRAPVAGAPTDDLASKGAAAFLDAKANVEEMISDAGDYAGKKGREAMDNVRGIGDTLAVAIEKSVTTRPYTTLALAVATGFLFGATWRR
jgi:ElaB/YqjD/DUF883 family membrane-anchored ribosome-binding protein